MTAAHKGQTWLHLYQETWHHKNKNTYWTFKRLFNVSMTMGHSLWVWSFKKGLSIMKCKQSLQPFVIFKLMQLFMHTLIYCQHALHFKLFNRFFSYKDSHWATTSCNKMCILYKFSYNSKSISGITSIWSWHDSANNIFRKLGSYSTWQTGGYKTTLKLNIRLC